MNMPRSPNTPCLVASAKVNNSIRLQQEMLQACFGPADDDQVEELNEDLREHSWKPKQQGWHHRKAFLRVIKTPAGPSLRRPGSVDAGRMRKVGSLPEDTAELNSTMWRADVRQSALKTSDVLHLNRWPLL